MAYVSLYRRYRPATFAEVVGQGHVTRTLTHALEEGRLHHAYLFTGPRGTGKTSTARILAKAVNCEQGPTPTPCGTCGQCVAIADGSAVDIIELDMASHGGVDDARELRDRALFAPASGRYKMYILDEVHMASTAAFNALLKLIEEPPPHVLFAMATTDPQKVLPTILSRVQRLDLRRVAADEVGALVQRVCDAEGFRIEDGAVEAVVRAGDGSVRDTLSVLEQVLAFAGGETRGEGDAQVTAAAVAGVLGHTPLERVIDAVDLLGARDLAGLLGLVQELSDGGHDLRRFTLDLVQHLRDLVVLQVAPDRPDLVDATDERRRRLQAQTPVLGRDTLLRAVALLAETLAEQRQGSPRLPLELALATLATPGADGDLAELTDRVARLEAGTPPARPAPRQSERSAPPSSPSEASGPQEAPSSPRPAPAVADRSTPPATPPSPPASPASPASGTDPSDAERPTPSDAAAADAGAGSTPVPPAIDAPASRPSPAAPPAGRPDPGPDAGPGAAGPDAVGSDGAGSDGAGSEGAGSVSPTASDDAASTEEPPATSPARPAPAPTTGERSVDGEDVGEGAGEAVGEDAGEDDDPLARITAHWEAILGLVKDRKRSAHAMYLPATPIRVRNRILTLRYAPRYASFHAENATRGEYSEVLLDAVERSTGLKLRVEAVIEGADARRPSPPSVTPDDARTPVLERPPSPEEPDDPDAPSPDEVADVREAEAGPASGGGRVTDELLASELGAELLEHRPAADGDA